MNYRESRGRKGDEIVRGSRKPNTSYKRMTEGTEDH